MKRALFLILVLLPSTPARSEPSPHEATSWPIVAPPPGSERAASRLDIEIGAIRGRTLRADLWAPPESSPKATRPAVVFLAGPADSAGDPMRRWPIHRSWMQAVAARGFVGIMADVEPAELTESHALLFRHLTEHGAELGVDPTRIALVASSASVRGALALAMGESAPAGLRAAVFLYGSGPATKIRNDLPVLFVVAGRDALGLIGAEESLFALARREQAPWIFVHALDVPHAFDALDRSANSRSLVGQVLDFLATQLSPPAPDDPEPQRSARAGLAALYGRDYPRAREIYERLSRGPGAADPLVWKNLAWACEGLSDSAATLSALDRVLELVPDDRSSLRAAGLAAARLGAWERAERSILRLGEPVDPIALEALGMAQIRLGRPIDAVATLARAVAATGRAETRYNYACALALAGDKEKALGELTRAVADGYLTPELATDPDLDAIRDDPRFQRLLDQMPSIDAQSPDGAAPIP